MHTAEAFMAEALAEARQSADEVPVGAVVVHQGRIIARAHNEREGGNPFAHAEMLAMERACQALGTRRLHGCTVYVTLEPCPMCAGALLMAEADACVFGAWDPRQGCCGSVYTLPQDPSFYRKVTCAGGVLEQECSQLLQRFFQEKRGRTD
ncbi:MAG: nucleoside deaminase [Clostridia bacterium]|nr:nucleoside deaminase [Clostridia bacterium]